jgi:hypothetical protein
MNYTIGPSYTIVKTRRSKTASHSIPMGIHVCAEAAARTMSRGDGVRQYYIDCGEPIGSIDQQVSKLRQFWDLGDKFGGIAVVWLRKWQAPNPPRIDKGGSTVSPWNAMVDDVRAVLAGKMVMR